MKDMLNGLSLEEKCDFWREKAQKLLGEKLELEGKLGRLAVTKFLETEAFKNSKKMNLALWEIVHLPWWRVFEVRSIARKGLGLHV